MEIETKINHKDIEVLKNGLSALRFFGKDMTAEQEDHIAGIWEKLEQADPNPEPPPNQ